MVVEWTTSDIIWSESRDLNIDEFVSMYRNGEFRCVDGGMHALIYPDTHVVDLAKLSDAEILALLGE